MTQNKAELLRALYESEAGAAFGFDHSLKVLWVNPACEKTLPKLLEGSVLTDLYPSFHLEDTRSIKVDQGCVWFYNRKSGDERILVLPFAGENGTLFVGKYYSACEYHIYPEDRESGDGVRLLSYYIRRRIFWIFNHLDLLSDQLEEIGGDNAAESLARIEQGCLALLRLSINLNDYYMDPEQLLATVPVRFEEFLVNLLHQIDFRLATTNLRLKYSVDCKSAVCEIDEDRLTVGLLDIVAASCLYAPQNGVLECTASESETEVKLCFQDHFSDFTEMTATVGEGTTLSLDSTDELIPLKRIGFEILERAVRACGGRCILENNNPGMKVTIRLPVVSENVAMEVEDAPVYTIRRNLQSRTSLTNILMADVP